MEKITVKNLVMGDLGTSEVYGIDDSVRNLEFPENLKAEKVAGKVKLTRLEDTILVVADLRSEVTLVCDRCLEDFQRIIDFHFDREYQINRNSPSDEDLYVDKYLQIDIAEPVREELILAVPMQNICREECKGICSSCGKNLNKEKCNCKQRSK